MPSDRAPLIPPVGSGVTGALVSIETCATLMVAPPRLTTGPSYVPGVNAVNAHAPGMAPDDASDPPVDQNLVSGTGPVHSNSSDMGSADNTPSMNIFRPSCRSRASAQAFGMDILFTVFLLCAGHSVLLSCNIFSPEHTLEAKVDTYAQKSLSNSLSSSGTHDASTACTAFLSLLGITDASCASSEYVDTGCLGQASTPSDTQPTQSLATVYLAFGQYSHRRYTIYHLKLRYRLSILHLFLSLLFTLFMFFPPLGPCWSRSPSSCLCFRAP